jgi:hypothetical protein
MSGTTCSCVRGRSFLIVASIAWSNSWQKPQLAATGAARRTKDQRMTDQRRKRPSPVPAEPPPDQEPAIDPGAADRALRSGSFDTTGYGEDYAAIETDSSPEEVEEAWQAAQEDVEEADLRLMDPADRLEPDRDRREGE